MLGQKQQIIEPLLPIMEILKNTKLKKKRPLKNHLKE
jgi:hypothetical protein